MSSLGREWDLIDAAQQGRTGEFRVTPSDVLCSGHPVLFGLDDGGNRQLLVPLAADSPRVSDRRSAGVHLATIALDDAGNQRTFLNLRCTKRHLNKVFSLLATEMLDSLRTDASTPLRTCRAVLARWRELLEQDRGRVLSLEGLVGLFAELSLLRDLVKISPSAVATWTGPLGTPFDFTGPNCCFEVKGSLASDWSVVIHGLQQLDPPAGTDLLLSVSQLQRVDSGGDSVPDLTDEIVALGADPAVLFARLARKDYHTADQEFYSDFRFQRGATRAWRVTPQFPRLVRRSFVGGGPPREIKAVTYVLDLSGMGGVALSADEVQSNLSKVAAVN